MAEYKWAGRNIKLACPKCNYRCSVSFTSCNGFPRVGCHRCLNRYEMFEGWLHHREISLWVRFIGVVRQLIAVRMLAWEGKRVHHTAKGNESLPS